MFNPALNNIEKAQIANTAKYFAQKENNEFFGLIFDIAIAQIYIEINKPQKAISILSDIKKTSENKKYFLINLMTYYYITKAYYKNERICHCHKTCKSINSCSGKGQKY